MFFLFQLLLLFFPPHIHPHGFFVSLCPLQIFVLGWWRNGRNNANGGRKVCVAQSLDVLSTAGAPISRFEVFWQPIMHLEVIWCEAEELRWGGCGMWVRTSVGKWIFGEMLMKRRWGGSSSCAAVPDSSLMVLVFASAALLNAGMHVHRHITQMSLFGLKPSSVPDKERVSHTHTAHMCLNMWSVFTDGWMDFLGL